MKIRRIADKIIIPYESSDVYRPAEDSYLFLDILDEDKFVQDDLMNLIHAVCSDINSEAFRIIDMGCGTGILGYCTLLRILGVFSDLSRKLVLKTDVLQIAVTFTDINADCVKTAKALMDENASFIDQICRSINIKAEINARFIESDLFYNLGDIEPADIIIFNPPYLPGDPLITDATRRPIDMAWEGGKTGLETTKRFFSDAIEHLKPSGIVLFIASSHTDLEGLLTYVKEKGYKVKELDKVHYFFEDIVLFRASCNKLALNS